jgi:hypothetical protein
VIMAGLGGVRRARCPVCAVRFLDTRHHERSAGQGRACARPGRTASSPSAASNANLFPDASMAEFSFVIMKPEAAEAITACPFE